MIDRVAARLGRKLWEVPVGFKWFVEGLSDGSWASPARKAPARPFCAATAPSGRPTRTASSWACCRPKSPPGPDAIPASFIRALARTSASDGRPHRRAGEPRAEAEAGGAVAAEVRIKDDGRRAGESVLTRAPGNDAAIGGLKVVTENGWFAARPSGTEDIYKIYAESFRGEEHLRTLR